MKWAFLSDLFIIEASVICRCLNVHVFFLPSVELEKFTHKSLNTFTDALKEKRMCKSMCVNLKIQWDILFFLTWYCKNNYFKYKLCLVYIDMDIFFRLWLSIRNPSEYPDFFKVLFRG